MSFNPGKANEPSDLEALDSGVQDIMRTASHIDPRKFVERGLISSHFDLWSYQM
jgi:hypothetical protein